MMKRKKEDIWDNSTFVKDGGIEINYQGDLLTMAQEIINKREGIFIAYDEELFSVIFSLSQRFGLFSF